MALPELFKVKQKRYLDVNGKRCKKSDPGAIETITKSDCWYADIKPTETTAQRIDRRKAGLPAPKRKRVKLCESKDAARKMLEQIVEQDQNRAAGVKTAQAPESKTLDLIVDGFERHLMMGGKKKTDHYIQTTLARVARVLDGCGFVTLTDIDCEKIETWLYDQRTHQDAGSVQKIKGIANSYEDIAAAFGIARTTVTYWRQKGAPIVPREQNDLAEIAQWHAQFTRPKTIGSTTNDHYITALKRFGNWMKDKADLVKSNPFNKLDKMNDQSEVRKVRRILEPEQFASLIIAASQSPNAFRGLDGSDRAMIYLLASYTGLRASEIGSLATNSFDLGDRPSVTVKAAYTKNGKTARIELKADLALRLKTYLDQHSLDVLSIEGNASVVWPGTWTEKAADMLRGDLAAAGIEYTVDDEDYDFHAFRHQFITNLFRAGVPLKVAQELARHSKPELTANIYAHLSTQDRADQIERLEAIPEIEQPAELRATGTDDGFLSKHMAKQELESGGISGYKGRVAGGRIKKGLTPKKTESNQVVRGGLEPPTHGFSIHHRTSENDAEAQGIALFSESAKPCLSTWLSENRDSELQDWLNAFPFLLSDDDRVSLVEWLESR